MKANAYPTVFRYLKALVSLTQLLIHRFADYNIIADIDH